MKNTKDDRILKSALLLAGFFLIKAGMLFQLTIYLQPLRTRKPSALDSIQNGRKCMARVHGLSVMRNPY